MSSHGAFGRSGQGRAGATILSMAAIVRHWSTMLNGSQVDFATFKQQTDGVFAAVKAKSQ